MSTSQSRIVVRHRNGPRMFVQYVRFCGNRPEHVAFTSDATEAGEFDDRQRRLICDALRDWGSYTFPRR